MSERARKVAEAIESIEEALTSIERARVALLAAGQGTSADALGETLELLQYERGVLLAVRAHYERGQ